MSQRLQVPNIGKTHELMSGCRSSAWCVEFLPSRGKNVSDYVRGIGKARKGFLMLRIKVAGVTHAKSEKEYIYSGCRRCAGIREAWCW